MKLTASLNLFNRGWGGPGRGLTTSLHLKCYIWCSTWPNILWIFMPDIICSCQYCPMRYRPTSVHVSCVLTNLHCTSIVLLYKAINTWSMLILCWASAVDNWHSSTQHCKSYSVNSIGLHRPNVFIMFGLCRKRWTIVKPILGQCFVLTETANQ